MGAGLPGVTGQIGEEIELAPGEIEIPAVEPCHMVDDVDLDPPNDQVGWFLGRGPLGATEGHA